MTRDATVTLKGTPHDERRAMRAAGPYAIGRGGEGRKERFGFPWSGRSTPDATQIDALAPRTANVLDRVRLRREP